VEVGYAHCAGLDVDKKTVGACLLTPGSGGQPTKQVRTFSTMTAKVLALGDWRRYSPTLSWIIQSLTGQFDNPPSAGYAVPNPSL